MTQTQPDMVAWFPKDTSLPAELTAAKVPPGELTELQWLEALASRVQEIAVLVHSDQ